MKNYKKIFLFIITLPLFVACFDDETTEATHPLSEIGIQDGSIKEVYNIGKNETLVISPVVTQTNVEKPLSYTWEIDLEVYSTEQEFQYSAKELGEYNCRFIVENEDGKTFFPFKLNVNSPYEEGITVISTDAQGKSMLSFMQTPYSPNEKAEFTKGDCFVINNPDYNFASNAVDIVQSGGRLVIACQGSGIGDDVASIYCLHEKTLVVENLLRVPEYDDFVPTILAIPAVDYPGISYPVLCENGKTYEYSTTEGVLTPSRKFPYTYAQSCIVSSRSGYDYDILFWDKEIGALANLYVGHGPYYCSRNYHSTREEMDTANYFEGKDFVAMTKIRMTDDQLRENGFATEFLSITKNASAYYKSVIGTIIWEHNYDIGENYLASNGFNMAGFSSFPIPLNEKTPCIANATYMSLLFTDGNKVRRWNYTSSELITNTKELLTVGSDDAIITAFEISKDHKKTYVAFYEPEQEGLNGSVWVFNTDTGEVLEKYDNVCYKPTKMIYKNK